MTTPPFVATTRHDLHATITLDPANGLEFDEPRAKPRNQSHDLVDRYANLVAEKRLSWTEHYRLIRRLGAGGQGVVFLTERRGADGFTLPVALKILSPESFTDARSYDEGMQRMAGVAARVAQIQHDSLLDVHNFVDRNRVRLLVMEWIDGFDLKELLERTTLEKYRLSVSQKRWDHVSSVIVTNDCKQSRFKPGVAVAIVRECLGALAALHREGLVHGDIKPSNIMLKRTGHAKIIDIGSAFDMSDPPASRTCTPAYAAPEILEGAPYSERSDLASIGYVLIELLAGRSPFEGHDTYRGLLEAKRTLPQRLYEIFPPEASCNQLLMNFCKGLIAPDPMKRYATAEAADFQKDGAASFLRQLVIGNLSSEYGNDLRLWLEELQLIEPDARGE